MRHKWTILFLVVVLLVFSVGIFRPLLKGEKPIKFGLDISGGVIVEYAPDFSQTLDAYKDLSDKDLLEIAKSILQSRLYTKLKITPDVLIRGDNSILVSVPNIKNPNNILEIVGQTFHLTLRLVLKEYNVPPPNEKTFPFHGTYLKLGEPKFSGDMFDLKEIKIVFNEGKPDVGFSFKSPYDKKFAEFTANYVGKRLAILIDNNVEMAPVINQAITNGKGVITGNYSDKEAHNVAMLLRSGSLPVSLRMESIHAVGPTLGQHVKESGTIAILLSGIILIIVISFAYVQRVWLLFSGLCALSCLLFSIVGLVSLVGFTIDIAAIAGAILGIGMGMDAFIIIFESLEIRLRNFTPAQIASHYGHIIRRIYSFSGDGRVLLHANLTTIIAILPIILIITDLGEAVFSRLLCDFRVT